MTRQIILVGILIIGAFAGRVVNGLIPPKHLNDAPKIYDDGYEYDLLATNLLNGKGFRYDPDCRYSNFRPPIYPLFLAGSYALFGRNFAVVRIIQILLSVATCLLLGYIAYIITQGNRRWAIIAYCFGAIYPSMIIYCVELMSETLYLFFITLACLLLLRLQEKPTGRLIILSGITLGVACLSRPSGAFFVLSLGLWASLVFKPFSKALRIYAALLAVFFLTLSPWMIRNYIQFHRITFVSNGGMNFWGSNNPLMLEKDLNKYHSWSGGIIYDITRIPESKGINRIWTSSNYQQFEVDQRCRDLAWRYLKSHPEAIWPLLVNKFIRFCHGSGISRFYIEQGIIVLGGLGLILALWKPKEYALMFFLALSTLISILIYFADRRMRAGMAPAMVIFATLGLAETGKLIKLSWPRAFREL